MALLGYKEQKPGLTGWLEIATEGLAVPARERITPEIEAHFTDSVEVHLNEGKSEEAAQVAALAELGDAQKAGKDFRRRHLTEREAKRLRFLAREATNPIWSFDSLVWDSFWIACLFLLFLCLRGTRYPWITGGGLLLVFTGYRLVPRWSFLQMSPDVSHYKRLALCMDLMFAGTLLACLPGMFPRPHNPLVLLIYYVGVSLLRPGMGIYRKLRRSPDALVETPPTQAAPS
jgi:hypothetical protein